jgi:hypothetical protein
MMTIMKNLYLNNGTLNTIFSELATTHNGILNTGNNALTLTLNSNGMKGTADAISFINGINVIQVDVLFSQDVRLSVEPLNESTIVFGYFRKGNLKQSYGVNGKKTYLKAHHSGVFNNRISINSILYFDKNVHYKFTLIGVATDTIINNQCDPLLTQLKQRFTKNPNGYGFIGLQNVKIAKKLQLFSAVTQKRMNNHLKKKAIIQAILQIELEHHTDAFTKIAIHLNTIASTQKNKLKAISNYVKTYSLKQLNTFFLIEK